MSVKVAINGFGRFGRLLFRQMFGAEEFEIVAINDLTSPEVLANLLKYDPAQGGYAAPFGRHTVEAGNNYLLVDGKKIPVYAKAKVVALPWAKLNVDIVLECSGAYCSKEQAQAHLLAGAKKVLISDHAGYDLPTIVYNVNHKMLLKEENVISAASGLTNCLAPMAKILNDMADIEAGIMCAIHANNRMLDTACIQIRENSPYASMNIGSNSTGAARAVGAVLPELNGKLISAEQYVLGPAGSSVMLNAVVKNRISIEQINAAMKSAANESFGYLDEAIASSAVVGMTFGSLFDATQTMVNKLADGKTQVQVVAWYDRENSYAAQMIRTIKCISALL